MPSRPLGRQRSFCAFGRVGGPRLPPRRSAPAQQVSRAGLVAPTWTQHRGLRQRAGPPPTGHGTPRAAPRGATATMTRTVTTRRSRSSDDGLPPQTCRIRRAATSSGCGRTRSLEPSSDGELRPTALAPGTQARAGARRTRSPEHVRLQVKFTPLLRRAELAGLPEHVPRIRRSCAPRRRRGLQASRRHVLGGAAVGAAASRSRLRAVDRDAEREVARDLALAGADPDARGLHGLGVERPLPGGVRRVHVRRAAGARLRHEPVRRPERRLRPPHLPRHA